MMKATGIRQVGNVLQMRIKRDCWEWEATGLDASQVDEAIKLRAQTQAIIDAGAKHASRPGQGTVQAFADRWLDARTNLSADDDRQRLKHVLTHVFESGRTLGALQIGEVRPIHARAVMRTVCAKGLAPRTILNIHSIARQMFLDAVADEVITHSPWVIPRKELPRKRDKDPKWRATALFAKDEVSALLFAADEHVPWDRRVLNALMYFGAMRFGEAAARRWSDRQDLRGMPALHVHSSFSTKRRSEGETKTESVRMMPEHPTLTLILDHWRDHGFQQFFGRDPVEGDLIVPSRMGVNRSKNHAQKKLDEDLDRLKLRKRRQHDLRRSFVSHAVDDGAERERLAPVTHGRGSSVMEMYDSAEWRKCREHVLRLSFAPSTDLVGMSWGGEPKTAQISDLSTFMSGGAGNRIRNSLRSGSGTDDVNSGTSTRDYRRRSALNAPIQGKCIPIIPMESRNTSRLSVTDALERAARRPYEPPRLETFNTMDLVVEALTARKARR